MKLIIALLIAFAAVLPAIAEDYVHNGTGIKLPPEMAELTRGKETEYPSEIGKGIAVPYSSKTIEATVFIRAVDAEVTAKALAEESIAVVKQLEKDGKYSQVKFFESDGKIDRPGWAKAAFMARADGAPFVSFTLITVSKGYSIKIRATNPLPLDNNIMKFVQELQKQIDSTLNPETKPATKP